MRILWQPPGKLARAAFQPLLAAALGELYPGDAPLPPAPDLLDLRLGDDAFALSYVSELVPAPDRDAACGPAAPAVGGGLAVDGGCGAGAGQLNAPTASPWMQVRAASMWRTRATGASSPMIWFRAAGVYGEGAFEEAADLAAGPAGELIALDAVAQQLVRIDTATGELAPLTLDTSFYRAALPSTRRDGFW